MTLCMIILTMVFKYIEYLNYVVSLYYSISCSFKKVLLYRTVNTHGNGKEKVTWVRVSRSSKECDKYPSEERWHWPDQHGPKWKKLFFVSFFLTPCLRRHLIIFCSTHLVISNVCFLWISSWITAVISPCIRGKLNNYAFYFHQFYV